MEDFLFLLWVKWDDIYINSYINIEILYNIEKKNIVYLFLENRTKWKRRISFKNV